MNREERERIVDSVLDRALGPQAVEPRPGFEERILANLEDQPARRRWWHWMWVPALAAAAVLAVVIGMRVMQKETPQTQQVRKTVETPKQEAAVKPEAPIKKEQPRVVVKHIAPRVRAEKPVMVAATEPRLDVFPSRGTLTPEEKLLLAFVRQQPSHARTMALAQEARTEEIQKYLEKGQVPVAGASGITK